MKKSLSWAGGCGWAGIFFLLLGAKLWLVGAFGNGTPFWDQWDAEADLIIKPFAENHLAFSQLFAAHNEHHIFFSNLLNLAVLKLNGLWDPIAVMAAQAVIQCAALVLLLALLSRKLHTSLKILFLAISVLLLILPFGWENTLWGFQSQFYFQNLLAVLTLWLCWKNRPFMPGWWVGIGFAVLGLFTMAGGMFAAFACLLFPIVRFRESHKSWPRPALTAIILFAIFLAGVLITPHIPEHDSLKASSFASFALVFLKICAWPSPFWLAWLTLIPPFLLAWQVWHDRSSLSDRRWLLLAFALWAFAQAAAIALGRNSAAFSSRYADNYVLLLLISLACLCHLRCKIPGTMPAIVGLWFLFVLPGVFHQFQQETWPDILAKSAQSKKQEHNVRAYVATGDPIYLSGAPVLQIPYPDGNRLRGLLDNPEIRSALPTKIRPPLQPLRMEGTGFNPEGQAPGAGGRDLEKIWGSFDPTVHGAMKSLRLDFASSPPTGKVRLSLAGYPQNNSMALILTDSKGARHNLAVANPGENWISVTINLPPGNFSLEANDANIDPGSWIAFTLPREIGRISPLAEYFSKHGLFFVFLGFLLLAGSGLLRLKRGTQRERNAAAGPVPSGSSQPVEVSFIISVYNQLEMTRACLASIETTMRDHAHEVILIDDTSSDGTRDFLKTLPPSYRVKLNGERSGFARNNNWGVSVARGNLLCFLNNDTVLLPDWYEPMRTGLLNLPQAGIIGNLQWSPRLGAYDHMGVIFNSSGMPLHFGRHFLFRLYGGYTEWGAVTAACCLIKRELFLDNGGFDTAFLNGSEDVDLCLRLSQKGYRHYVANQSLILHYVSSSPGRHDADKANEEILQKRWKETILQRWSPRDRTLNAINYALRFLGKPWRYNGRKLFFALVYCLAHPHAVSRSLGFGGKNSPVFNRDSQAG